MEQKVTRPERLHELTSKQFSEWADARREEMKEYERDHAQRYNLVDVMEKLIDAFNILNIWADRFLDGDGNIDISLIQGSSPEFSTTLLELIDTIELGVECVILLDRGQPDAFSCDAKGGKRVWWGVIAPKCLVCGEPGTQSVFGVRLCEDCYENWGDLV